MSRQDDWRTIAVGSALAFRVPADARERSGRPVDSLAGVIEDRGYEITYDYGRFSERIEVYRNHAGYARKERRIGNRTGSEASFEDREGNPKFPFVRLLRVEDGANALVLRVSCLDKAACSVADGVFDSVEFR